MNAWRREEGTISAMVAVLAAALLAMAGLAYDGGAIVTATAQARDIAAGAARAGAQQLDVATAHHQGVAALDPTAATAAADSFLATAGMAGTVSVEGASVTVTVRTTQAMRILPLPDRPIAATATATAASDVLGDPP
jgi:Flp pilus assembly protein TadG